MSNQIDFYFDIISPFSYIAHKKIQNIKKNKKINFNYKPVFLGGLHKLAEIDAPAFNKYKIKILQSDCELVAGKNDIPFIWNSKFPINSLYIMRGYLCVEKELKELYLDALYNAYWRATSPVACPLKLGLWTGLFVCSFARGALAGCMWCSIR